MKALVKLLVFYCCIASTPVIAQNREYVFKNFTQEEGLPSNETYCVFEDSRHFLWIGTDHGVVRYNGSKFETLQLPDNVVFFMKEDKKGRIWFFTQKAQLSYFENEQVHPYEFNKNIEDRIKRIQIVQAYFGADNSLFLNSALDSNYRISPTGQIDVRPVYTEKFVHTVFSLQQTSSGEINCQRLLQSIPEGNTIDITLDKTEGRKIYRIERRHKMITHYGAIAGKQGDTYFYCGNHLFRLLANGSYQEAELPGEIVHINYLGNQLMAGVVRVGGVLFTPSLERINADPLLKGRTVTGYAKDYEGGTWLSTLEEGLFYIKNTNIQVIKSKVPEEVLVSRLLNLGDTQLLYSNSNGLFSFGKQHKEVLLRKNSNVSFLEVDKDNNLYLFGGFDTLGASVQTDFAPFKAIHLLSTPREAVITDTGLIISSSFHLMRSKKPLDCKFSYDQWVSVLYKPGHIYRCKDGAIWSVCSDGIYWYDKYKDTFLKYMPQNTLLKKGVTCLRELENGYLVVGIRFGGIAVIKNGSIVCHITEREGLLSDKTKYILPLGLDVWVATAKGISVITFTDASCKKYSIHNIGKNDGFYNLTINQLVYYQHSIIAATNNGMYFLNRPDLLLRPEATQIPFYITAVKLDGKDTSGISTITLPYGKSSTLVKYTAVCFNSAEQVVYMYRFSNTDTNWTRTSSTELPLENFEPGTYNLQLKAFIPAQNRASEVTNFTIIVDKAWWHNNFLRLVLVLLIAAGIYAYFRKRLAKIKAEEQQKTTLNSQLFELEQTALRSQMNSHFVFNCLTSIQQLIVSGNKTDASEFLVKFARLIRKTLEISTTPFISVAEEADYLKEYLSLEQLRMTNQFDFKIEVAPGICTCKIPNMLLQPIVENCVRHGVKTLEDREGLIHIAIEQAGNLLKCTITDNGVGRDTATAFSRKSFSAHKSYGMEITQKRLHAFYSSGAEKECQLQIVDLTDEMGQAAGTQVIITLPLMR